MAKLTLPTDYTPQRKSALERRIQQTVELLEERKHTLILLHNDPDPDAIASGRAMEVMFQALLPEAKYTLAHGGLIGRAENRTMAQLFMPHALRIPTFEAEEALQHYDAIILVDSQPGAGNHLLYGTDYPIDNVLLAIDHHPPKRSQVRAVNHDVRPEVGACSTMLCEYLAVAEIDIDAPLATALFYGIKSDTRGLSRHTDELDIWAYTTLRNLIDTDMLNEIEHVQLPRSYFRALSDALDNTMLSNQSRYYEKRDWFETMDKNAGKGLILIGDKKTARLPDRTVLLASLPWAIDLARTVHYPGLPEHVGGLAAYDAWADALEVDADYPGDDGKVLETRVMVHGDQVVMLEERRSAAAYLRQMAKAVPEVAGDLDAAAAYYEEAATFAGKVWRWGPSMGREAQQGLADAQTRRSFAGQIRVAKAKESQAVAHLERALVALH